MKKFNQIYVENLVNNIEKFYKGFYFNKLYKGLGITFSLIVLLFLLVNFFVFYGELSGNVRFILFYTYVIFVLSIFYSQVLIPILQILRLKDGLSKNLAAEYIGTYFPEIKDKLLNTIEFMEFSNPSSLALASIDQRSKAFSAFDFKDAVIPLDLKKFGIILLIPIMVLFTVIFSNSEVITSGTYKLVNYNKEFLPVAPFEFNVIPGNVDVILGSNVTLKTELKGSEIPNEVFIEINGVNYRMSRDGDFFSYELNNVRANSNYRINSGKFFSKSFTVGVTPLPRLSKIQLEVFYPEYTGLPVAKFFNVSTLELPYGSKINWKFSTTEAISAEFLINTSKQDIVNSGQGIWKYYSEVYESFDYSIDLVDGLKGVHRGENHRLICLKDAYPTISVNSAIDSTGNGQSFFTGRIGDDYGFRDVSVVISNSDTNWQSTLSFTAINGEGVFNFSLDHSLLNSSANVKFLVRDNDAINGYKVTESTQLVIEVLTQDELDLLAKKEKEKIVDEIEKLSKNSELLDKDIQKLNEDLIQKRNLDWEDQKRAEEMLKTFNELQKKNEEINKMIRNSNDKSISKDQEILEKQRQLEELFDRLLDEETKELFKELEELMKNVNKDDLQKHLEKMKVNQEDISKELDRNLEIFKQLELEQGLEQAMEKIQDLSKKQEELAEKNKNKEISNSENLEEQKELTMDFEEVKKELARLDSLNKELKEPNELDLDKEKQEEVSDSQKASEEESKAGQQKESAESQKDAAEKMKELQEKMEESFDSGSSDQQGEDLESMRKLLENLLVLSFDQEKIMVDLNSLDNNDPLITDIGQRQQELVNSSVMVKDSLFALSSRVPQINDLVTNETKLITANMENALETLAERKLPKSAYHQQKALTSINNLAVLMDEIIQQMQEQQKNKKKGSGSCSKPGEGSPKPSLKSSKKKQEELAKKMAEMKKKLEKGNMPGKMNPGKMGEGMSKQVAEMAAQQEVIREELRKMMDELQKEGDLGGAGQLKELEELMEKNEEDIINLKLDQEFMNRQREIETKLLKAENAKRERELDSKRKSEQSNFKGAASDRKLEDYLKAQQRELELLRLSNPNLNGFYKNKVKEYNSQFTK